MQAPEPVVLERGEVRLEPLSLDHVPDLLVASTDPDVWRWLSEPAPRDLDAMSRIVEATLADRTRLAWAVLLQDRAVGSTSYLDVDLAVGGLEIGWTWYARTVWRTAVNPSCKLLLLGHAFDDLGAERVHFKADALNARSRRAITRLGAQYDGTLRHHRLRSDGSVRDSAYYSVLTDEWPIVRDGLLQRLG